MLHRPTCVHSVLQGLCEDASELPVGGLPGRRRHLPRCEQSLQVRDCRGHGVEGRQAGEQAGGGMGPGGQQSSNQRPASQRCSGTATLQCTPSRAALETGSSTLPPESTTWPRTMRTSSGTIPEKGARNGGRLLPASCRAGVASQRERREWVAGGRVGACHSPHHGMHTELGAIRQQQLRTVAATACRCNAGPATAVQGSAPLSRTSARNVTGSASWRNSCSASAPLRTSRGASLSLPTAACGLGVTARTAVAVGRMALWRIRLAPLGARLPATPSLNRAAVQRCTRRRPYARPPAHLHRGLGGGPKQFKVLWPRGQQHLPDRHCLVAAVVCAAWQGRGGRAVACPEARCQGRQLGALPAPQLLQCHFPARRAKHLQIWPSDDHHHCALTQGQAGQQQKVLDSQHLGCSGGPREGGRQHALQGRHSRVPGCVHLRLGSAHACGGCREGMHLHACRPYFLANPPRKMPWKAHSSQMQATCAAGAAGTLISRPQPKQQHSGRSKLPRMHLGHHVQALPCRPARLALHRVLNQEKANLQWGEGRRGAGGGGSGVGRKTSVVVEGQNGRRPGKPQRGRQAMPTSCVGQACCAANSSEPAPKAPHQKGPPAV